MITKMILRALRKKNQNKITESKNCIGKQDKNRKEKKKLSNKKKRLLLLTMMPNLLLISQPEIIRISKVDRIL
jgi:ABC-type uncharacterized transport system ATPase subunit